MSERIEWTETETRENRCWLRVVRCWTSGRLSGQGEAAATVDDLRRACEAAGLTLASAQHAEDLEKLGREMAEVVAQRDEARQLRDEAIARAEKAEAEVEDFAGLVRELNPRAEKAEADRAALEDLYNQSRDRSDDLAAELAAIRSATGEEPTDEVLGRADNDAHDSALDIAAPLGVRLAEARMSGRRALYNLGRTAALGEVARMREEVATLRARVAELEAIAREAESQANDMVSRKIAALGMAVNGAEDEEMVSPDVQVVRGDFVMTKFRERLARIDAASPPAPQTEPTDEDLIKQSGVDYVRAYDPGDLRKAYRLGLSHGKAAPQGQPVATDEELRRVFADAEASVRESGAGFLAAERAGIAAMAARVRAERPACLVARAVALGCDVGATYHGIGGADMWEAYTYDNRCDLPRRASHCTPHVPAADVPATLARLLDEVEARKGGAK